LLLGCVAAAAIALDSDHAAADIRYTMPGAVCHTRHSATTGTSGNGWFVTTGTRTVWVQCPVMRDFTDDPMSELYVRIQDSNDSSDIPQCKAYSYQNQGAFFEETPPVNHTNPGGFQSLSLDVEDLGLLSNYAVNVSCEPGKNDAILNLRYVEAD
jgi:hypothetical protein